LGNFGGPCNGRCSYIFWTFGLFYGHLILLWTLGILCGNLVYFSPYWYIVPKNLATLGMCHVCSNSSMSKMSISGHLSRIGQIFAKVKFVYHCTMLCDWGQFT
jgi:hypothetical protein